MFTGLIEEIGTVVSIRPTADSIRLTLGAHVCGRGVRLGDSIAVNGACLTVVKIERKRGLPSVCLQFDLLQETWTRTSLSGTRVGSAVNLERALAVGARLGGHFVTGHVDDTGVIKKWERSGKDYVLEIDAPRALRRFFVPKGSVAVDGISLTVAATTRAGFRCWIIPHTREVTALNERRVGERVNLETDLLGKYVEKLMVKR